MKPENLLYATTAEDSPLKLADFGLAYLLKRDELMHSSCGTPGYVAPEILKSGRGGAGYGKEVDMWSVGVILYILLCGFPPFYDEDNIRLFAAIQKGKYDFPSPYWDNVSAEAIDLIRKLLCVDATQRYTAKQTLAHRWLTQEGGNSVHLSHFQGNMKAYNARRRLRHAIRTVQFLHMIHGFKNNGEASSHFITNKYIEENGTEEELGENEDQESTTLFVSEDAMSSNGAGGSTLAAAVDPKGGIALHGECLSNPAPIKLSPRGVSPRGLSPRGISPRGTPAQNGTIISATTADARVLGTVKEQG